ncbi:hypothetical protein QNM97_13780 [Gordonia sp. L191]|uniref:hypothetical protein n=1 Tax=Gordonia sp. L191 TaxID=2982699 RepID=UPI0024C09FA9|nr:hypothetical protein [Gordonia sp. L191]WHU45121.1 hypothetical protein QNM97_13780 [Gordonia sp. L191]
MLIALIVFAVAVAASVSVNIALALRIRAIQRDPLCRRILQRLVITSDDPVFTGVLREVGQGRDGHVVFSDCQLVEGKQVIAGDVIKAKSQIVTYQVPHAAG